MASIMQNVALGTGLAVAGAAVMGGAIFADGLRDADGPDGPAKPFQGLAMIGLGVIGGAMVMVGTRDARAMAAGIGLLAPVVGIRALDYVRGDAAQLS